MDDKNKKALESLMEKKSDVELGEELFDLKSQINSMECTLSQLRTSNMSSGTGNQEHSKTKQVNKLNNKHNSNKTKELNKINNVKI